MTHTSLLRAASLIAVLGALGLHGLAAAQGPVNKCLIDGSVTYQQGPCPSNGIRERPTLAELNAREKARRAASKSAATKAIVAPRWRCDGRAYCEQMTSCAEAKFFLMNCPDVKMDGNRDGIPCEKQWCTPERR